MINEDKVEKYLPSVTFGFKFDVERIEENREAEFKFELNAKGERVLSHPLKNLTVVNFLGPNNESGRVIISNSLIHQYIGARKKGYKYYTYFYLKENIPY